MTTATITHNDKTFTATTEGMCAAMEAAVAAWRAQASAGDFVVTVTLAHGSGSPIVMESTLRGCDA